MKEMTPEELAEFEKQFNQGKLRAVNAHELLTMQIPPREHILEPIIQTQSTSMLFSKRGVGKTYISLGIAAAVAAGTNFLRWRAPKARRVLYIEWRNACHHHATAFCDNHRRYGDRA
jgi:AAA domain